MTAPPPSSPPAAEATAWGRRLLAWLMALALLALLLGQVPAASVVDALRRPPAMVWAVTLAGLMTSYALRAARLQVVMGLARTAESPCVLGLRLDALRVILMHNAAVNLLPMRAGELSFPWLASSHLGMPMAQAVATLLWMRLQDLAVLAALGLLLWPGLADVWRLAGLVALMAGWRLATFLVMRNTPASGLAGNGTAGRVRKWLGKLRSALAEPHHHRWPAWAFTAANWTVKLAAGALLLSAITQATLHTGWAGALGGELAAVVPLQGPAGFGTYEAGVWAGYALHLPAGAYPLSQAVTAALALHVCLLVCAVLAGALAWALGPRGAGTPPPHLPG